MTKELDIVISEDGRLRFVYDDDLADLIPAGYTCPIQRASHVEPAMGGGWEADMRPALELMTGEQIDALWAAQRADGIFFPSTATVTLGPFATRAEALAAEVAWLKTYAGV